MRRKNLHALINEDSEFYLSFPTKERIKMMITQDHFYLIHKYMVYLRKEEYYRHKGGGWKVLEFVYALKKNRLGNILGFYIKPDSIGAGTIIYHNGAVIVNGGARIGKKCKLHGNNCIGNNGKSFEAPNIGNGVDIGFGASIIGNVFIADNVKIGAGAVVVKSCFKEGATLVGIPAREV